MRRRVVITGLGVLSAAGANVDQFRQTIAAGTPCFSEIRDPRAARLRTRCAALLPPEAEARLTPPSHLRSLDRQVHLALVAARDALAQARVDPRAMGARMGLIFATCSGPMLLIEEHYERIVRGESQISGAELVAKQYYSGAHVLAMELGLGGWCTTVVTACSASTGAVALAVDLIRCGMLDAALAGGSDAFSTSTLAGFEGLKATCEGRCAPFSKPFGLNLGEAAAFVVLESAESARHRGAAARAEILGLGMSNDAYHCSAPEPSGRGLAAAMRRALADAGVSVDQIGYINAHGTGTEANDKAETRAVRKVLGNHAERVPISSTKSMVGHCLGAAGTVELAATLVCAQAGVLPPTANFDGPREGCSLDCVPDAGRPWNGSHVFLTNNAAFGGHNASLVVSAKPVSPEPKVAGLTSRGEICLTACGLVTPLGLGTSALLEGVRRNRSAAADVALAGDGPVRAAMVNEAEVERFDRRLDLRDLDRSSRWAAVAARLAIREARIPERVADLSQLGFYLHLGTGPSWAESEYLTSYLGNGRQVSQVTAFPYIVPSSVSGNVCRALMLTGHNLTFSAGPAAGLLGLGPAVAALRGGHAPAVLSGAVDELTPRILADRRSAGLLAGEGSLPGEGAAMLVLETEEHAAQRGARPLAVLLGLAFAVDREGGGVTTTSVVRLALEEAGVAAGDLGAFCVDGPLAWIEAGLTAVHPGWQDRRVTASGHTGHLEAAQPLVDLATALSLPRTGAGGSPRRYILAVAAPPTGVHCAAVFKKIDPAS